MFARSTFAFVVLLVLLAFGSYPFVSSAQTPEELNAQIQSIRARIAELSATLESLKASGASGTVSEASCVSFTRTLSFGSRGEDVRGLQDFLIEEGALASGNGTGYFGPLTEAAVKRWQAERGIVSYGDAVSTGYGVVGPKTRTAIIAECARNAQGRATMGAPPPQASPTIVITTPREGVGVAGGETLRIAWQSTSMRAGETVSLSLFNSAGKNLGTIVRGVSASGEYLWRVPREKSDCGPGMSAFDCIMAIGGCEGGTSICSLPSGVYRIAATLSSGVSTTSPSFQIAAGALSGLLGALLGTPSASSSLFGTLLDESATGTGPFPGSCMHEGTAYTPGTTLSVPCSGNCPSPGSGTGFITGACTGGQWCIPYTAYCATTFAAINLSAYEGGGGGTIASGYSVNCPQEGYSAYLSCPYGGCQTGWNTCKRGVWVRDTNQQYVRVGTQGPCMSGQVWCEVGTEHGFGCVMSWQCVNGMASSTP